MVTRPHRRVLRDRDRFLRDRDHVLGGVYGTVPVLRALGADDPDAAADTAVPRLGKPLTLIIESLPRVGPRVEAGIRSQTAKVLTFPGITTMYLIITPFVLYFTSWYVAGFHSVAVRELTHLALMSPGFVFFWTLLRVDPVPKAYPYIVSLWVTGAEVVGDAVLGLAVIADVNLIAGALLPRGGLPMGAQHLHGPGAGRRDAVDTRRHRGDPVLCRPAHPDDEGRRGRGQGDRRGARRQGRRACRGCGSGGADGPPPRPAARSIRLRTCRRTGRGGSPTRDSSGGFRRSTTATDQQLISSCAGPGTPSLARPVRSR